MGSYFGHVHALRCESQAREQAVIEASTCRTLARSLRNSQSHLEELVRSRTSELKTLSTQLITSQDEERRRIARDLHDSTGHKIAVLKIDLAMAQKEVSLQGASMLAESLSLATEI
jgi:signal transduction histidine kinase